MRIAIVTSSYPLAEIDGAAAAGLFVRDFAHELAKNNHEIHIITQDKGEGCSYSPKGVTVHCFKWPGKGRPLSSLNPWNPFDAFAGFRFLKSGTRELLSLHERSPVDHVLAMWAVPGGIISGALRKEHNVPYSVWCLGSDIWTYGKLPMLRAVVSNVLQGSTNRYADGLMLKHDAEEISNRPIEFLPSSRAVFRDGLAPLGTDRQSPRFQFVGRYDRVKGVDVLLQAFRRYIDKGGSGTLHMIGGGAMDQEVRELHKGLNLTERVEISGYADGDEVRARVRSADCLLIPSRNESIPLVFSDALQLGTPVIASDVGDMGDLLRQTPAGIVVQPEDVDGLAQALRAFEQTGPELYAAEVNSLAGTFDITQTAKRFLSDIGAAS
ncbi:MAG: glycosyltransferase [Phycisphaera sp.]|nr:MAG: glycosyltransferase [Phycisphaera sp.]